MIRKVPGNIDEEMNKVNAILHGRIPLEEGVWQDIKGAWKHFTGDVGEVKIIEKHAKALAEKMVELLNNSNVAEDYNVPFAGAAGHDPFSLMAALIVPARRLVLRSIEEGHGAAWNEMKERGLPPKRSAEAAARRVAPLDEPDWGMGGD